MYKQRLPFWGMMTCLLGIWPCHAASSASDSAVPASAPLLLNKDGYFEKRGLNVMAFSDFYPEGHQTGVTVILNGSRLAANGDLRLQPAGGQWQPIPRLDRRVVDPNLQAITAFLSYPDPSRNRKGFNPIEYPDLTFSYKVRVVAEGEAFRVIVDLNEPLPQAWAAKVGFNLELFPGEYFGAGYAMDDQVGAFPRQFSGPMPLDSDGTPQGMPLAVGRRLSISPERPDRHMIIESKKGPLELLDGRAGHDNGWFVVRSVIAAGATAGAVDWRITCHGLADYRYAPVIHVSQVGYHPRQGKVAVIELDKAEAAFKDVTLYRVSPDGAREVVLKGPAQDWGSFLRYHYLRFDFSQIAGPGLYVLAYGDRESNVFQIRQDVFSRHVWQPTLEYFLPVQMCHMRVSDRYRVWHGLCHMDDALMAPVNHNHFDGYIQGPSTLCPFSPQQPVPGLSQGGWHDAGDDDLRIESQIETVRLLVLARELFGCDYDVTTVDQDHHVVRMHRPDGVPDILQQIEHGVLTVLAGYRSLGRPYRGIICPTVSQYVILGDTANVTDGRVYDPNLGPTDAKADQSGAHDDRWVFTEDNPRRELEVAAGLAAASRALKTYRPVLASECLSVSQALFRRSSGQDRRGTPVQTCAELLLATGQAEYRDAVLSQRNQIRRSLDRSAPALARIMPLLNDPNFASEVHEGLKALRKTIDQQARQTPFGVPYRPSIWGAGWDIQGFGVNQLLLHKGWPDLFGTEGVFKALDFVLGCHPGENTASFVSGVGGHSVTVAYGANRADWSHIPGGAVSGTALIRPDLPELKQWPFSWQQTEYVMGGGTCNYLILALAADSLLNGR